MRFMSIFQTAGRRVLEAVFPREATAQLPDKTVRNNAITIAALKSGVAYKNAEWMKLVAGSRSEGLGMDSGWGHEPADIDIMYLYGGGWGVRIGEPGSSHGSAVEEDNNGLMVTMADCPECYCKVGVTGDIQEVGERMGLTVYRTNPIRRQWKTIISDLLGILVLYVNLPFPWIVFGAILLLLFHHAQPFRECQSFLLSYYYYWLLRPWPCAIGIIVLLWLILSLYYEFEPESLVGRFFDSIFSSDKNFDSIGAKRAVDCFVKKTHYSKPFLSSPKAFNILCDVIFRRNHKGPSLQVGVRDLVPGLVCSGPFLCISGYTQRNRWNRWPHQEALNDIASIPGILVPTGNTESLNCTVEWRYSFSPQELRLAQDMPGWVKAGYRAFKYTYKCLYKKNNPVPSDLTNDHRGARPITKNIRNILFRSSRLQLFLGWNTGVKAEDGRKHVSSYHLKTVLLWSLEFRSTWREECCFRLMVLLLRNLAIFLTCKVLPHYFNPKCNLLQNISREELGLARSCVEDILSDPVQSIINAPSDRRRIKKRGVDLFKLHGEYKNALGHIRV